MEFNESDSRNQHDHPEDVRIRTSLKYGVVINSDFLRIIPSAIYYLHLHVKRSGRKVTPSIKMPVKKEEGLGHFLSIGNFLIITL